MKVKQFENAKGLPVKNQFLLTEEGHGANGNFIRKDVFQSYESIIAERIIWDDRIDITLDLNYWDYSQTTGKYRNLFLNEDKDTTKKKIASGEYKLANLN